MGDSLDPSGSDAGAAAIGVALNAGEKGQSLAGAPDEAREFLRRQAEVSAKQSRLLDLQIENLQKADEFENSHLRWRRFNEQMGGALQIMVVLVGLAIVAALGAAVWNAASDNGLVIEAFSVPPDLAARGLTGEVIANKVLDRLSLLQAQTASWRVSSSYANNWGDDIKVQIPNTGVSIGEFNRALHQWLGHETRISGEVYRTPVGVAVSARVGTIGIPVVKGGEADIDTLVDKAAEQIYCTTQPYRCAMWLSDHGRAAEAVAVLGTIVATGTPLERGWAYNGMASITIRQGKNAAANRLAQKALDSDPDLLVPRTNLIDGENWLGHDEAVLESAGAMEAAAATGDSTVTELGRTQAVLEARLVIAQSSGDYVGALDIAHQLDAANDDESAHRHAVIACAHLHDDACFRAWSSSFAPTSGTLVKRSGAAQEARAAFGRWGEVLRAAPALHAAVLRGPPIAVADTILSDVPLWALALAHEGDFRTAHGLIDPSALDCVFCLRVHGRIDALEHNWAGAAWWFARAEAAAPSSPFPETDWGEMLLRRGDPDGAIARFATANRKGPHFADPIELWGEALIAQNRSDLALTKFEAAARYAPNWGRLHLKWGEALLWLGRKDDARSQFGLAAGLDLSPSDSATLRRLRGSKI